MESLVSNFEEIGFSNKKNILSNILKFINMSKKISPKDNKSNQANPNKGTPGTNKQNSQVHGNRGKQLNPNQQKGTKKT